MTQQEYTQFIDKTTKQFRALEKHYSRLNVGRDLENPEIDVDVPITDARWKAYYLKRIDLKCKMLQIRAKQRHVTLINKPDSSRYRDIKRDSDWEKSGFINQANDLKRLYGITKKCDYLAF